MEQLNPRIKVALIGILLLLFVEVVAYAEVLIHFSTYLSLGLMIFGTLVACRFLFGSQA